MHAWDSRFTRIVLLKPGAMKIVEYELSGVNGPRTEPARSRVERLLQLIAPHLNFPSLAVIFTATQNPYPLCGARRTI
jgi:hypothetical protein